MAVTRGSIDLTSSKSAYDAAIDVLNDQISLRVAAEERLNNELNSTNANLSLKIDRATDSNDLISNINAVADQIALRASQINFSNNRTVENELADINSAISIDTENETIRIGSIHDSDVDDFYILITPTEMGFYKIENQESTKIAYMKSDALYVQNNLSFGRFVFTERANGHFTLKLIDE